MFIDLAAERMIRPLSSVRDFVHGLPRQLGAEEAEGVTGRVQLEVRVEVPPGDHCPTILAGRPEVSVGRKGHGGEHPGLGRIGRDADAPSVKARCSKKSRLCSSIQSSGSSSSSVLPARFSATNSLMTMFAGARSG